MAASVRATGKLASISASKTSFSNSSDSSRRAIANGETVRFQKRQHRLNNPRPAMQIEIGTISIGMKDNDDVIENRPTVVA